MTDNQTLVLHQIAIIGGLHRWLEWNHAGAEDDYRTGAAFINEALATVKDGAARLLTASDNQAEAKVGAARTTLESWISDGYAVRFDVNGYLAPDDIETVRTLLADHSAKSTRLAEIDRATANRDARIAGKSLGEKLFDALYAGEIAKKHTAWSNGSDFIRSGYEADALRFATSLTHDETASAVIAAQAEEIERLGSELNKSWLEWFRAVDHLHGFAEAHNDDITTETLAIFYVADQARYSGDVPDVLGNAEVRAISAEASIAAQSLRIASLTEAMDDLVSACEREFGVPDENDGDGEAVGAFVDREMDITFGMLRRARAALSPPQPTPGQEGAE